MNKTATSSLVVLATCAVLAHACGGSDSKSASRGAGEAGVGERGGSNAVGGERPASAGEGAVIAEGGQEESSPSAGAGGAAGGNEPEAAGGGAGAGGAESGGCPSFGSSDASAPATCLALLQQDAGSVDGKYTLDLDGSGPSPALSYYCDMTGGGWTLVANQVPASLLPDTICTVNPESFGRLDASYRLGMPDVASIHPTTAWKLTDPSNTVYFKPACVVDWTINYDSLSPSPTACTTGYTALDFGSIVNGAWIRVSARGIGINNFGAPCSIRMYESHMQTDGTIEETSLPAGQAAPCDYQKYSSQSVSLWFR